MSNKDKSNLLAVTIGSRKEFKRDSLGYKGETFEFIQPSLRERNALIKKVRNKDGTVDDSALMVEAVIALTVYPGTTDRVFDDTHRDSMLDQPSGSFVDAFSEKALNMLSGSGDSEELGNESPV